MVKFVVVTIKSKMRPVVENGQLSGTTEVLNLERQESKVNDLLLKGFHVIETTVVDDLKGVYIVFTLYKPPPNS